MNYPGQYKGDVLSEAFATEFSRIIESRGLGWIYSYQHQNVPRFEIGKTNMFTNQFSYVHVVNII